MRMCVSKKMRVIVIGVVAFFMSGEKCNGMEENKLPRGFSFSKKNNERVSQKHVVAELIASENLPDYIGKTVLWKKNSKYFYVVQLGERVGDTRSYKIYQTSNTGVVCTDDQLYRLIEGKEKL